MALPRKEKTNTQDKAHPRSKMDSSFSLLQTQRPGSGQHRGPPCSGAVVRRPLRHCCYSRCCGCCCYCRSCRGCCTGHQWHGGPPLLQASAVAGLAARRPLGGLADLAAHRAHGHELRRRARGITFMINKEVADGGPSSGTGKSGGTEVGIQWCDRVCACVWGGGGGLRGCAFVLPLSCPLCRGSKPQAPTPTRCPHPAALTIYTTKRRYDGTSLNW